MMRSWFAAAALALAACATPPTEPSEGVPAALINREWVRVDDVDASPHFPTLNFEDSRASGYGGCNRWFASVERAGDRLRFGAIGATRMACPGSSMQTERNLFDALERTRRFRLENEVLMLLDGAGAVVGRFEDWTPPPEPGD